MKNCKGPAKSLPIMLQQFTTGDMHTINKKHNCSQVEENGHVDCASTSRTTGELR